MIESNHFQIIRWILRIAISINDYVIVSLDSDIIIIIKNILVRYSRTRSRGYTALRVKDLGGC